MSLVAASALVQAALPLSSLEPAAQAGWASQDIGAPAIAGSSSETSGTFTIQSSGYDIWGASDQFQFVYQPMTGDADIVARVDSIVNTASWAKAGLMMRETLAAGSKHTSLFVTPARGIAFQRRTSTGGTSTHTAGSAVTAPYWVRLVRQANTFTAYESPDANTWRQVGTQSITMAATIYVGLAVTSHNRSALTTALISNVAVTSGAVNRPPAIQITSPLGGATYTTPTDVTIVAGATDTDGTVAGVEFFANGAPIGSVAAAPYAFTWNAVQPGTYRLTAIATDNAGARTISAGVNIAVTEPPGPLSAPWSSQDIGAPALAGSAGSTTSGLTITGAGADIWGTGDQFQFAYQSLTGDGRIVARVASLERTAAWAKAGVMIRESLAAGSRHAYALVSAGNGVAFQRRRATDGTSTHSSGTFTGTPRWVGLTRKGDIFQAYESADGTTWRLIASDTIPMAATVYVGPAVTSHNVATVTTATFTNVTVTGTSATNQPPTVRITSPAGGTGYTAPATVLITADAADADGTVSKVEFYAGSTLVGTGTTSPYSVSWSNVAAGTYSLTAVATDNAGAATTSAAVSVTVDAANQPPIVGLTSPSTGATFTAPATIALAATASDPDGSVARVEFYQGATLIGAAGASPYTVAWANVPAGSYMLTARAIDNTGATTISDAAAVTVTAANQPPVVALTSPTGGLTFGAPASVVLGASASDPDGTIARVEFYIGTALLASATASPYSVVWDALTPGTYTVTAVAVDNTGARTTSGAAGVTANPSLAVFTASADHDALVTSYRLDIFAAGADPATATPVAMQNLGKPTPVNGDISADITATLQPLVPGPYIATVSAVGADGESRSTAVSFTR